MSRQGVGRPRGSLLPAWAGDDAVARHYHALKDPTLARLGAKLRARRIPHSRHDLEDYYQQAWLSLQDAAGRDEIASAGAFLVQVAYRRALDDVRRSEAQGRAELAAARPWVVEDTLLVQAERRRHLREFVAVLADRLHGRARTAAALCYLHGFSRAEAAAVLGLSPARMKRVMDDASRALADGVRQIAAGAHCDGRHSANTAYALGLLDPSGRRFAETRAHLRHCPRCRRDVLRIRQEHGARVARPAPGGRRRGSRPDVAGRPPRNG